MSCIHNSFDDHDSWGGCIHCATEERNAKFYDAHNPPKQYDPPQPTFDYDPLYYHTYLKKTPILSIGEQFTIIDYLGIQVSIPNKIIRLKGKKQKLYVHKNIFNDIIKKHGLPPINS